MENSSFTVDESTTTETDLHFRVRFVYSATEQMNCDTDIKLVNGNWQHLKDEVGSVTKKSTHNTKRSESLRGITTYSFNADLQVPWRDANFDIRFNCTNSHGSIDPGPVSIRGILPPISRKRNFYNYIRKRYPSKEFPFL